MKNTSVSNLLKLTATTVSIISATAVGANAAVLSPGTTINTFLECLNDGIGLVVGSSAAQNGWYYATDASNDSTSSTGGTEFEIYGMGIKETQDSILVTLKTNASIAGVARPTNRVADGNIGWGDMFFNFSGLDFMTAMNQGKLFGVKFAGTNDSPVANVGLYSGVTAVSVTGQNNGWASINAYNNYVGSKASLGDLSATTNYFDKTKSLTSIASGTYLSGITFLNDQDLVAAGYNLNKFAGSQTIAFKLDKSKLPGAEPAPKPASVPEPTSMAGLAVVGLAFASSKLRKQSVNPKKA